MANQDNTETLIEEICDLALPMAEANAEYSKLRIAYWEKLILFNAGAITLSFTAASTLREHAYGDGGVGYLFCAWRLLICSIIAALLAQKHLAAFAENFTLWSFGQIGERKMRRFRESARVPAASPSSSEKVVDDAGTKSERFRKVSNIIGRFAEILMVWAYVDLYRFAHTNLQHFALNGSLNR